MRIVLDIQSLQSASRLRGIGRYTRSLITALARENHSHEIIFLLNGSFDAGLSNLIKELRADCGRAQFLVCQLPSPTAARDPTNVLRERLSEFIREWFIAELQPDLVHVFSLLEGFEDNVVGSIGRLPACYPVSATFYDLIPLLNPDEYLRTNKAFAAHYEQKIQSLKRADGLLAISHFSAIEAVEHLGCSREKVGVATLGPLMRTTAAASTRSMALESLSELNLSPGFLLYVGGSDPRKNLPRLVEAWCALPDALQNRHPLVMVGSMPHQDVGALQRIAKAKSAESAQLRFLGQVSDELLSHLYTHCSAFVFPSWHEGFGLPALEAMAMGSAVIAANTSSLPEVVGLEEALFDPGDVSNMARLLERVLVDQPFRHRLHEHAPQQAAKFSWQKTAQDALIFFERTRATFCANTMTQSTEAAPAWQDHYPARLKRLFGQLAGVIKQEPRSKRRMALMSQAAAAIERNEQALHCFNLQHEGTLSPWLIEGPFDSSYSLALLNRELARALAAAGVEVRLHSTEGPGDFDPNPQFLAQNPDLAAMVVSGREAQAPTVVGSRLMYPPRVNDMSAEVALLHLYGWEEGEFPQEWAQEFNRHLQGITTMSHYVRKVLIDNGVTVPVAVAGVGVDHWERVVPDPRYELPFEKSGFAFLHVSSCFPRKGVDVLLKAWGDAFTREDDVTLIIKTFPNPHNTARQLLESARASYQNYPDVIIIEEDLSDSALKALMLSCDALVAPSRGEGFGLPIADAMLSGVPVIATGYGGHMDFCDPQNAWLVDFTFARARTHFALSDSIWAEPDCKDLARQLRAVYEATPEERKRRALAGRDLLLGRYSWEQVAGRVMDAALDRKRPRPDAELAHRIGWVSSWNTRCGIAGYSGYLLEHFEGDVSIFASHRTPEEELDKWLLPQDGPEVTRCWSSGFGDDLSELREALFADLPGTVVIQFNYGFFEFPALSQLIVALKKEGVSVVVMFHSTFDPPELPDRKLETLFDSLVLCDRLLLHSPNDLNRLKAIGLVHNTALLPHGVMDNPQSIRRQGAHLRDDSSRPAFCVASFGFLLPHKGLEQLLDAISILRAEGRAVTLKMLNAEYPATLSRDAIAAIKDKIINLGLEDVVTLDTTYYTDEECLERLARADLIVFPYQSTHESSSAAVRHAIASGTPVAVTPLDIFDDVAPAVIQLNGTSPQAISESIKVIQGWSLEQAQRQLTAASAWQAKHSHSTVGGRLEGMIRAVYQNDRAVG